MRLRTAHPQNYFSGKGLCLVFDACLPILSTQCRAFRYRSGALQLAKVMYGQLINLITIIGSNLVSHHNRDNSQLTQPQHCHNAENRTSSQHLDKHRSCPMASFCFVCPLQPVFTCGPSFIEKEKQNQIHFIHSIYDIIIRYICTLILAHPFTTPSIDVTKNQKICPSLLKKHPAALSFEKGVPRTSSSFLTKVRGGRYRHVESGD